MFVCLLYFIYFYFCECEEGWSGNACDECLFVYYILILICLFLFVIFVNVKMGGVEMLAMNVCLFIIF